MPSHAWKAEERAGARLIGGARYPANQGGLVDCEAPDVCAQVKHVRRLSLAALERLALEAEREGGRRGKAGLVIVKRRAGRGCPTPRLCVMTEAVWENVHAQSGCPELGRTPDVRENIGISP